MINAVILLNDDLDFVSDCDSGVSGYTHNHNSNLMFLLSVSIPRPLFPSTYIIYLFYYTLIIVAGYPIIYHHVLNLSKIDSIRNVFLIGNYDPKKFTHFIEDLLAEFSF